MNVSDERLRVGERVRYSAKFCEETSTTEAGRKTCEQLRGIVVEVHSGGKLCNVDWGDRIGQSLAISPELEREV